jgi:hypothetical protein
MSRTRLAPPPAPPPAPGTYIARSGRRYLVKVLSDGSTVVKPLHRFRNGHGPDGKLQWIWLPVDSVPRLPEGAVRVDDETPSAID